MAELWNRLIGFVSRWFPSDPIPDPAPAPEPAPDPTPPPHPVPVPPSPESSVAAAINQARTAQGLAGLAEDPSLARLARSWAGEMASSCALDHGDFAGRITSIYPNTAAAENIAEGQPDAATVVAAWLEDPPHRANILGLYNRVGVGLRRDESGSIYWCADFAMIA